MAGAVARKRGRKRWAWLGAAAGVAALLWVLRDFEPGAFLAVIAGADAVPLLALPVVILLEQVLRAAKWQQILRPLQPVRVWRLFGAIMVGYLSNFVVPVRVSPLVRAWLVARLENMRVSTLLATIAIDRLIDGVVFVGLAATVVAFAVFPDEESKVELGLAWGTAGSLALLAGLAAGLVALRRTLGRGKGLPRRLLDPLPARLGQALGSFVHLFAEGIVLPRERWRRAAVVVASLAMKVLATLHFALAGLAFGVVLAPVDYLFLMVFLGFLMILAGTLRLVGGFTAGAVYALGGLGVGPEAALAMALVVQGATVVTVAATGAGALWLQGMSLGELRAASADVQSTTPSQASKENDDPA